ncbi:uncharacterized protein LOC121052688 [Rosa chinensis]|uniref:uncharacterized protein LOC121052688 n=1 Tax=Rosa chinensis TaxID=74649 RepID=UPI001AD90476|nr:uncharacterized protein LOC121052688 [Rosa chinensis]
MVTPLSASVVLTPSFLASRRSPLLSFRTPGNYNIYILIYIFHFRCDMHSELEPGASSLKPEESKAKAVVKWRVVKEKRFPIIKGITPQSKVNSFYQSHTENVCSIP